MTMRVLYLESFAGIAGDMFAAAFLDAGLVSPEAIRAVPRLIKAPNVEVEITETQRAQARFTKVRVVLPDTVSGSDQHHVGDGHHHHAGEGHHQAEEHGRNGEGHSHHGPGNGHHHYHYPDLVRQLEESDLDLVAKGFALRVFGLLAEAEADSHGVSVEKVTFHEVGAVDSVVDVAMAGVCVAAVGADRVLASPVKLGRGTIQIQHGTYPVPPPASARLAVGMPVAPVPDAITLPNVELSTPTGLAILRALEPEFQAGWPSGTLLAQGSGAGTRELGDYPNVFRVALLEESHGGEAASEENPSKASATLEDATFPYDSDTVVEVRCNVDDQTGERTAWLMEKALELGALDAWVIPVVGKKGRPAACMAFLVDPEGVRRLCDFLLRNSSSFGVRYSAWNRFKLLREEEVRETPHGPVSFKIGRAANGERLKEKPEFEDLRKIWEEDPDFKP